MKRSPARKSSPAPPPAPAPAPTTAWVSPRWLPYALAAGLALATLAVFWPALQGGFVNYDDPDYLSQNRQVQQGLTGAGVRWAFTTGHASNWHPLTWLSHMADWQMFGESPRGHHFTSILLHALNAGLVLLAFRGLTGSVWRSLILAGFFALHPLRVESVAWLSERKDVLSTAFWLLALLSYAGYARRKSLGLYLLTALCLALGLMAKPMLVTLPCVLLLLDYWPLRRFENERWTRLAWEKLPLLAVVFASALATFLVQRAGGAVSPLTGLPVTARIGNALVAYVRYLIKAVWPTDLAVLYPHPGHWPVATVMGAALFLLAVSVLVWKFRARAPWLAVGWCWFLGTLVPVIGLVQVGIQSMADRYTYVPMLGIVMAVVWTAAACVEQQPVTRWPLAAAATAYLILLVWLTDRQIGFWRNSETLFQRTVAVTRNNYLAYNNLGYDYSSQGRMEKARAMYEQSLAINSNYEEAQNNLGYALTKLGRPAEALPHFEAALRLKPNLAEAHNNYGNALADLGRDDEAVERYQAALRINPDLADAHNNLGIALAMKGQFAEAIGHLETSLRLKPKNASAHSNLGNAYAVQHQLEAAARHYAAALALNPDDAQTHNNLGNLLAEQGKLDEAVSHYETALRLNAKNPEARFNLGVVFLRQERRPEAISQWREALRLKPDYTEARRQLQALETAPAPH